MRGMGNMQQMMRKMQKMQKDMLEAQEGLKDQTVEELYQVVWLQQLLMVTVKF